MSSPDSIRQAIANKIDEMESNDVVVLSLMLSMLVIALLATAFIAAPQSTATFLISAIIIFGLLRVRRARATSGSDSTEDEDADPVATLQERYANGEITSEEFESRMDRILESEQQVSDADVDRETVELDR